MLIIIFGGLGLLHIYWVFGGRVAVGAAVPSVDGKPLFVASPLASAMIAAGLFAAMLVIVGALGRLGDAAPAMIFRALVVVISLAFLLRAIGDFKYIGFFKAASDSSFAYWDTRLYSPLCLFIAVAAFYISLPEAR